MLSRLIAAGAVASVSTSALAAITVTQSIDFASIAPFGTYTDSQVVAGGWKLGGNPVAFPFANPTDIESVLISFASTDRYYQDEFGPTPPGGQPGNTHPDGGVPMVEVNFLNPARVGIVSLTKTSDHATLFEAPDAQNRFHITRELLADVAGGGANPGNLGVRLGGFVSFYDNITNQPVSTDSFTFGPTSTFTVSVTGTPTPEPTSLATIGLVSVVLLRRR